MKYQFYRLLTIIINTKGGESETIEKMTKEVDGVVVPCNLEESKRKMWKSLNSIGGNPATRFVECYLIDQNGGIIKYESTENNVEPIVEEAPLTEE